MVFNKKAAFQFLMILPGLSFLNTGHALTLDEAINISLKQSPVVLKNESAYNESVWKKREQLNGFLPNISAGANHLFEKKYMLTNVRFANAATDTVVPQILPTTQFNLSANLSLFDGLTSVNKFRSASSNESAAASELNWTKFKTEMEVRLAYYKILANKNLKEVSEQNLKVLKDHLKEIKLFKQNGMATTFDILKVEVVVSNAETDVLNTLDNITIAEKSLSEILGNENTELNITGSLPAITPQLVTPFDPISFNNRLDLIALRQKVEAMEYNSSANKSFWAPKLSINGLYTYYNNLDNSITDSNKFRNAYQIGIQISWNLFDGFSSISKSYQSSEQYFQAQKNYRIAELKAQKDFEIWKRKLNYFSTLYRARLGDVEKSKESVRLAKEGRRVGSRTNTDLLDAESELYKSQAGVINAQIGAIEALINLQLVIGEKLTTL